MHFHNVCTSDQFIIPYNVCYGKIFCNKVCFEHIICLLFTTMFHYTLCIRFCVQSSITSILFLFIQNWLNSIIIEKVIKNRLNSFYMCIYLVCILCKFSIIANSVAQIRLFSTISIKIDQRIKKMFINFKKYYAIKLCKLWYIYHELH